ncbi:MAG: carbohydrate kinase family protein [Gammaproteobacteria bacterium]|jgi:adenosine kinase|nr:carbohydrate kinase family protein [Gammaproteobacteria bacterium]MDP6616726.1 carbohydrate kinase family protein [Gammaproteobacteria bacterium]MDP6695209.1 carbohydrate kinase family protein [Gammaproteobacteria bacterium]MDP7041048.1 carbohydrate kinase family protein [Gammaproteobacteria bacterium]
MSALICGSMAYDNIMVFPGRFKEQILPDQIHILNVAFLVPVMRKEFGGCAGNIAYNLNLLGGTGFAMATVGTDFEPYRAWLEQQGLDSRYLKAIDTALTAQAYITTDLDDNQITAFHPGAMDHAHLNEIPADAGISIGMISPDGKQGMVDHAHQFAAAGIPFVFDPGQGLPMFDGDELRDLIAKASWVAVNDYEGQMLQERTGWSEDEIGAQVDALIVTRGAKGSAILSDGERIEIPAVEAVSVSDPTGCGDAYRAGLLYGLLNQMSWADTGRLAAVLGAIKVASQGTQNHDFTRDSVNDVFEQNFGYRLDF